MNELLGLKLFNEGLVKRKFFSMYWILVPICLREKRGLLSVRLYFLKWLGLELLELLAFLNKGEL